MLDTLSIAQQLKESGLSENQAQAIAHQMGLMMKSELASQKDIEEVKREIEVVKREIEVVKSEAQANHDQLELKIEQVRAELKSDIEKMRLVLQKEIKDSQLKTVLWVAGLLVANSAMMVSLLKLL